MEFKKRQRTEIKPEENKLAQKYPQPLMLYELPPTEDIVLEEFENLATDRLKLLRIMEQASLKNLRYLSDDYKEYINGEASREGLKGYLNMCAVHNCSEAKLESILQMRRRDHISHFILRLAYCRTDDLRRWFQQRETELFKYRFSHLSNAEIRQFLKHNNFNFVPLTEEQRDEVKDGLYESTMGQSVVKIELTDFYKVHFSQVPELVRARRCYLKGGFAYVSINDLVSIVTNKLHTILQAGLDWALKNILKVNTDERLYRMMNSLHTSYTGKDYSINKNSSVPLESIDQLSKKSFPLCMRSVHEELRSNHHLKHGGRMQYGLFLKGIGVTLEDSLRFWREEFTKKMDSERFTKTYEYNIYHNYGKKGSMINYSPYSCLRIISGQGEVHGCTFKMFDAPLLRNKLLANGLSQMHMQEVMNFVQKGHYQLACSKYFQIMHEIQDEVAITHPNQYFEMSQAYMGLRTDTQNSNTTRTSIKRKVVDPRSLLTNADDDAELWLMAETQEEEQKQQLNETS